MAFSILSPTFWQHTLSNLRPAPKHTFSANSPHINLPAENTHNTFATQATLALDTGASITVIDKNLADLLEIKPSNRRTTVLTASGNTKVYKATIDSLTVLGKTQENTPILITRLPQDAAIDGLLGLSFLRHYKLQINFQKNFLTLS